MAGSYSEDYYIRVLCEKVTLREVMDTHVVTVGIDQSVSEAQLQFIRHGVTHLIVVDKGNKLAGLLTPKYLYKTQSPRKIVGEEVAMDANTILIDGESFYDKETLDSYSLRKIIMKDPFSLFVDESLARAIAVMAHKRLSCIPIIDADKKVCGIVTDLIIVQFIARILEE